MQKILKAITRQVLINDLPVTEQSIADGTEVTVFLPKVIRTEKQNNVLANGSFVLFTVDNNIPLPLKTMYGCILSYRNDSYYISCKGGAVFANNCISCSESLVDTAYSKVGICSVCAKRFNLPDDYFKDKLKVDSIMKEIKWKGWVHINGITKYRLLQ